MADKTKLSFKPANGKRLYTRNIKSITEVGGTMRKAYFEEKKRLIRLLKNENDFNLVVQQSSKILDNPFVVHDTSYNLLAYTKNIKTDDIIWNEFIKTKTFSQRTIDFFKDAKFIAGFAESEVITIMKSHKLKYDRINGKLFDKDGIQIGNITVVGCKRPFEDFDVELIEVLCEVLSKQLQKSDLYKKINRIYKDNVLSELIDGSKSIDKKEIALLYERMKPNIFLAVVDIIKYDETITHLAYIRDRLKKISPESICFVHLNHIVMILSTENKCIGIRKELKKLNDFFRKCNLNCGISSRFCDLKEVKKRHGEAINALNYGTKNYHTKNIFFYDNFRLEHILNSSVDTFRFKEFVHPVLLEIQEYDRINKANLLSTLYLYLTNGLDWKAAMKGVKISVKECVHNLSLLKNTFKVEFKNADMLFSLYFSIKMLDRFE